MMGKTDGTEDNQHQGRTGTLEGNKEISHRPWYRRIRISRTSTQEGATEEMSNSTSKDKPSKEERMFIAQVKESQVLNELSNVSTETKQKVAPIVRMIAETLEK